MNNVVTLKLTKPQSDRSKLDELCEWIDAHIDQPLGWAELSAHSHMDHLELQRQFCAHLKTSPMQWIRTRRIECNKASMAQTMEAQLHTPKPMQLMVKTN
jgi:transcriptional regulator GlxA family with amidase domain